MDPSGFLGLHISRFYPEEGATPSAEEALGIAVREGHFREEGWRVRVDGSRFWADVTLTALRDRGRRCGRSTASARRWSARARTGWTSRGATTWTGSAPAPL